MNKLWLLGSVSSVAAGLVLSTFIATNLANNGPAPSDGTGADVTGPGPDPLLPTSQALSFSDPLGDATDTGAGDAATMVGCAAGYAVMGECVTTPIPVAAGTPGPHYDITAVRLLGETARTVILQLQVAKLSEGFPELKDPDLFYRMNYYTICWAADENSDCDRSVQLDVMVHAGHPHVEAKFEIRNRDCTEVSWCSWGIPVEFKFGAPALMTFTVPKAYLTFDGAPAGIHHLQGQSGWISEPTFFPAWHPGATVHTPVYHVHDHGGAVAGIEIADVTERFMTMLRLAPWTKLPDYAPNEPLLLGGSGSNHGAGSQYDYPEMDILWYDMYEENGEFVTVFKLREFKQIPSYEFDYSVEVGIQGKAWEIGYRHEGDRFYGYAGRCIMEPCQGAKPIYPKVDLTFGAPGAITIRTPLKVIENPPAGTVTSLTWAMTMYTDQSKYFGDYNGDYFGDVHSVFMLDSLVGGNPYVFGSTHKAPLSFELMPEGHQH